MRRCRKLDEDRSSMTVRIRLARGGTKKRPFYRIVATSSRTARDGGFLEKLGTYNPILPGDSPERIVLREERIRYWLGVGAQPSDRVARFLDNAGITESATRWRGTGKKAQEVAARKAEAAAAAAAAAPKKEPVEAKATEPEPQAEPSPDDTAAAEVGAAEAEPAEAEPAEVEPATAAEESGEATPIKSDDEAAEPKVAAADVSEAPEPANAAEESGEPAPVESDDEAMEPKVAAADLGEAPEAPAADEPAKPAGGAS
jgi:small subunit ribosomal protein S16